MKLTFVCFLVLLSRLVSASPLEEAGRSVNGFAFDFAHQLRVTPTENLVFSPYSISTAFAMVREGAKGETQAEINHVFHFARSDGGNVSNFGALGENLRQLGKSGAMKLETANGLWVEKQFPLLDSFTKVVREGFLAQVEEADFAHQPEVERAKINQWVEDRTEQRIKNLLPEHSVSPATRLVLANAVYFKGRWETPFPKEATQSQNFQLEDGTTKSTSMMQITHPFAYSENQDLQCVELPYDGQNLSMVLILPKNPALGSRIFAALTLPKFEEMLAAAHQQSVRLTLPRFQLQYSVDLLPPLQALGIQRAFGVSDFSGISAQASLNISTAVHKAWIQVNEEGTEAAAATAVGVRTTAILFAPIPEFRADHPFLFLIREKTSGAILFMGVLANPEASSI